MIDLEQDLVAIEVALRAKEKRVVLGGVWQQPKQRLGLWCSKRIDSLTLAVVGDGRCAGKFRAPPEPQIGCKEERLASLDRPAQIGIEVVAVLTRLAGKSVSEALGCSTRSGFPKERNGIELPVAKDFGRHAVKFIAVRLCG